MFTHQTPCRINKKAIGLGRWSEVILCSGNQQHTFENEDAIRNSSYSVQWKTRMIMLLPGRGRYKKMGCCSGALLRWAVEVKSKRLLFQAAISTRAQACFTRPGLPAAIHQPPAVEYRHAEWTRKEKNLPNAAAVPLSQPALLKLMYRSLRYARSC